MQEEKEKVQAQKEEVLSHMNDVLENELQCIICSEYFIEVTARGFSLHALQPKCPWALQAADAEGHLLPGAKVTLDATLSLGLHSSSPLLSFFFFFLT